MTEERFTICKIADYRSLLSSTARSTTETAFKLPIE